MQELPLKTFDEIERIINLRYENEDAYGMKNKNGQERQPSVRRMADTYKRVREIATKYSKTDQDIEDKINKYVSANSKLSTIQPGTGTKSNMRHRQLQSLSNEVNQHYKNKLDKLQKGDKIQMHAYKSVTRDASPPLVRKIPADDKKDKIDKQEFEQTQTAKFPPYL